MSLTQEHKEALAVGRRQGRIVRRYLDALNVARRPGRRRSTDKIRRRLAEIEEEVETADPLNRLRLIQERMDLSEVLEERTKAENINELEKEFVDVAAEYSARKGLSTEAWKKVGVPSDVLSRAGIN